VTTFFDLDEARIELLFREGVVRVILFPMG
jgi:hypothetical protein